MTDLRAAGSRPHGHPRLSVSAGLAVILAGVFVLPALTRLLGGSTIVAGALAALPFAAALYLVVILANHGGLSIPSWRLRSWSLLFWALLLIVSLIRSNNQNHTGISGVLFITLWVGIIVSAAILAIEVHLRGYAAVSSVLWAVSIAGGILATANVVLQLAGIESVQRLLVDHPEGRLAQLLGLRLDRTLLPMARGINNFGVVAGMGVAGSLAVLSGPRQSLYKRLVAAPLLLGSIGAVVYVDSRGPLLFGVLAGLGVPLLFRARRGGAARYAALLAPALPLALLAVLSLAAQSELVRKFSRQQGDIASATGRALIWGAAAGRLAAAPSPMDAIGYGQYGAKGAGVSVVWASRFKDFEADPLLTSTHNLTLQLIYDVGYVGLIVILAVIWRALATLGRLFAVHDVSGALPASAVLVFLLIAGTTEATVSIIFPESLVFISLLLALTSLTPPSHDHESTS